MRRIMLLMASVLVLGLAAGAQANSVTIGWVTERHRETVTLHAGDYSVTGYNGQYMVGYGSQANMLPMLCIEVEEYSGGSWTANIVDLTKAPMGDGHMALTGGPPMNDAQATLLRKLWAMGGPTYCDYSKDWDPGQDKARAMQLAAWEIVYEYMNDTTTLNVTTGNFYVTGSSANSTANTMLNSLADYTGPLPELVALSNQNPGKQDFVRIIPEPVTMAGLMLGIGGLGGYIRRRRRA